eukprot:TRINITY_DN29217_c0_g1_i2.p1 TRINITY_DN29217_c0_g1~~TRINITY_DN29217_c0_g1_i2.p1  ORF type:complete len:394 (-),score=88.56 TRINITY_DN29217_c0_g1_i2:86-1267(-)
MLPRSARRIQRLARVPIQPVTIQELVARSTYASDAEHVAHAKWIRAEVPIRLAHRLTNFMQLPYVFICNARINEVFKAFLNSFEALAAFPEIDSMEDTAKYAIELRQHVRGHERVVGLLQEGYTELKVLLDDLVDLDEFLNQVFFTRIGNRLLAEHFMAVHEARMQSRPGSRPDASEFAGIVNPNCKPAEIIEDLSKSLKHLCADLYGLEPEVVMEGELDTELSFVPDHLRFMLQEIIKNALRATCENNLRGSHAFDWRGMQPVSVEIMKGSFDVTIKVSDAGGGMRSDQLKKIWKYGYTSTVEEQRPEELNEGLFGQMCGQDDNSMRQMAGYGFGLPLSRVYAQYFGGDIHVQSMHGYGTDVYLNINHLGDIHEAAGQDLASSALQSRLAAS